MNTREQKIGLSKRSATGPRKIQEWDLELIHFWNLGGIRIHATTHLYHVRRTSETEAASKTVSTISLRDQWLHARMYTRLSHLIETVYRLLSKKVYNSRSGKQYAQRTMTNYPQWHYTEKMSSASKRAIFFVVQRWFFYFPCPSGWNKTNLGAASGIASIEFLLLVRTMKCHASEYKTLATNVVKRGSRIKPTHHSDEFSVQ